MRGGREVGRGVGDIRIGAGEMEADEPVGVLEREVLQHARAKVVITM